MTQIVSTKQLTPDGILGYAKGIAAVVAVVLGAAASYLPDAWDQWVQLTLAVCGAIAVIAVPNAVKPTPPAQVEPAGKHEAG